MARRLRTCRGALFFAQEVQPSDSGILLPQTRSGPPTRKTGPPSSMEASGVASGGVLVPQVQAIILPDSGPNSASSAAAHDPRSQPRSLAARSACRVAGDQHLQHQARLVSAVATAIFPLLVLRAERREIQLLDCLRNAESQMTSGSQCFGDGGKSRDWSGWYGLKTCPSTCSRRRRAGLQFCDLWRRLLAGLLERHAEDALERQAGGDGEQEEDAKDAHLTTWQPAQVAIRIGEADLDHG